MLSKEQQAKYEQIRQTAVTEIEALDRDIEAELAKVKTRLLELQEAKKAVKQILDGASSRLGTTTPQPFKELNLSELTRQAELAKV
jgi:hypothetical protein